MASTCALIRASSAASSRFLLSLGLYFSSDFVLRRLLLLVFGLGFNLGLCFSSGFHLS